MSKYLVSNSNIINIKNTPKVPNIGYYKNDLNENIDTTNLNNPNTNSYNILSHNLTNNCTNIPKNSGILGNLDEPYKKAVENTWNNGTYKYFSDYINDQILALNINDQKNKCSNQIQYLVCQLINSRNRYYNIGDFITNNNLLSLSKTFKSFGKKLFIPLIFIFTLTIYFLVSGVFSSIDVIANIINIIQKNNEMSSIPYWLGILFGLVIPAICIIIGYKSIINQNLEKLEKSNISNDPYGNQQDIPQDKINIDYMTMILFVLLIFTLIGVLFTVKKSSFSNLMFTIITSVIFCFITLLVFIMYYFIPFFNTAETGRLFKTGNSNLQLFIEPMQIDTPEDTSYIYSNQTQNDILRKVFVVTGVCITVLAIVFLKVYSGTGSNTNKMSFFGYLIKGFLSSSAILLVPILWVINFLIGIQFFFVYPIFLILVRFIRYVFMLILYFFTRNQLNPRFSDDLTNTLKNFENYSAPWGLFGIEELKIILGMFGYDNVYSKSIIGSNNVSYDISNNKFVSSGLLYFFAENNKSGMFTSIVYVIVTIIISIAILFGMVRIQNIK